MNRTRIVVAEDEEIMASMLQFRLEKEGYDVTIVIDGNDAVSTITELHPAITLLDLGLPELNGMAVLRQLRSEKATASLPIIVLSGNDDGRDINAAIDAGADDYLLKPVDPATLLACIKRHTIT